MLANELQLNYNRVFLLVRCFGGSGKTLIMPARVSHRLAMVCCSAVSVSVGDTPWREFRALAERVGHE
ncbi:MAG: hypothetical protein WCP28_13895 [Actinomycetes bacterium]